MGVKLLFSFLRSFGDEPSEVLQRQELDLRHRGREGDLRGVVLGLVLGVAVGVGVIELPSAGLWSRHGVLLEGAMVRRSRHHVVVQDGAKLALGVDQRAVAHEQQRVLVLGREPGLLGLGGAPGGGPGGGGTVPATAPGQVVQGCDLKSHLVARSHGRPRILTPPCRRAPRAPSRWVRSGRAIFGPTRARVPLRRPARVAVESTCWTVGSNI